MQDYVGRGQCINDENRLTQPICLLPETSRTHPGAHNGPQTPLYCPLYFFVGLDVIRHSEQLLNLVEIRSFIPFELHRLHNLKRKKHMCLL